MPTDKGLAMFIGLGKMLAPLPYNTEPPRGSPIIFHAVFSLLSKNWYVSVPGRQIDSFLVKLSYSAVKPGDATTLLMAACTAMARVSPV